MDASVGSRGAWSPRTAHQLPVGPAPTASPILSSFNRPELAEVFPLVLKTHLFQNHTIVSSLHNHQGSRSVSFHHGRLHLSRLPTAQAPARRHGDPLPVDMGTLCPSWAATGTRSTLLAALSPRTRRPSHQRQWVPPRPCPRPPSVTDPDREPATATSVFHCTEHPLQHLLGLNRRTRS